MNWCSKVFILCTHIFFDTICGVSCTQIIGGIFQYGRHQRKYITLSQSIRFTSNSIFCNSSRKIWKFCSIFRMSTHFKTIIFIWHFPYIRSWHLRRMIRVWFVYIQKTVGIDLARRVYLESDWSIKWTNNKIGWNLSNTALQLWSSMPKWFN